MAAEVSTLVRIMNKGDNHDMNESSSSSSSSRGGGKSTALITRDLLGGCSILDSKELDLDLQVPSGWEKHLDLKSGKVYLQRRNSSNYFSSMNKQPKYQTVGNFQDLNSPPASNLPLSLFEDTKLDLKLISSSSSPSSSSSGYNNSVCTLEKVKFALERAEKESLKRKRSVSESVVLMSITSSPTSNSSISSIKDTDNITEHDMTSFANSSFAAGCPSCLLYVLISKTNPRCPRCDTIVPISSVISMKKPRIDLNISM
ncbi:uncharacterized protein LOC107765052 [Nicotiana tabacum]|uniref:Uncharacterized protein LOC107765052 n=1 Tax=Nicotiana tabacum TaxID=4097 RepID=A0A1S3XHF7_TOBAC|nr:PREDICTED: uncharacterized protein LOC107765052 [Nicotiana tabacum]